MNGKHALYAVLMAFLSINAQSFSMYPAIFKGAKFIGAAALPTLGVVKARNGLDKLKNDQDKLNNPVVCKAMVEAQYPLSKVSALSGDTDRWVRKEIERFGVQYPQSLPILSATDITVELQKTLLRLGREFGIDSQTQKIAKPELNAAILSDKILVIKDNGDLDYIVQNRDNDPKSIARLSMILGHEMKHRNNQDTKKSSYFNAVFPLVAQGVYSSVSHVFNKRYGITQPQTFLKTALRSSVAVGSIVPKLCVWDIGLACYGRYQEAKADEYACQHAKNRLELEMFRDYFKDVEKECYGSVDGQGRLEVSLSDSHPYPGDRAAMAQKYLDKKDCKT